MSAIHEVNLQIHAHLKLCRDCSQPYYTVRMRHVRGGVPLKDAIVSDVREYMSVFAQNPADALAKARNNVGHQLLPSRTNGQIVDVYTTEKRLSDSWRRITFPKVY